MKTATYLTKMASLKNVLLLGLAFGTMLSAKAQNFQDDLKAMGNTYASIDQLNMEIEVNVFATHKSENTLQQQVIAVQKKGHNFCYTTGEFEALFTKKSVILVDHQEHSIHKSKADQPSKRQMKDMLGAFNPQEMFPESANAIFKGVKNGWKQYRIEYPEGSSVELTDVFLNEKTLKLEKVVYYYNVEQHENASKIEIRYTTFDTKPTFKKNTFSEKRYVTRNLADGSIFFRYQPTEKYANYDVTSQE